MQKLQKGDEENGDKGEVDEEIGDLNTDEKDNCLHLKGLKKVAD